MINRKNILKILFASLLCFDISFADSDQEEQPKKFYGKAFYNYFQAHGVGGALMYDLGNDMAVELEGTFVHTKTVDLNLNVFSGFLNAYYILDIGGDISHYLGGGIGIRSDSVQGIAYSSQSSFKLKYGLGADWLKYYQIVPYAGLGCYITYTSSNGNHKLDITPEVQLGAMIQI